MKRNKLVWIGPVLLIVGLVLMAVGFFCGAKVSVYVTSQGVILEDGSLNQRTENQLEPFQNLDIQLENAELRLIPSDHYGIDMCYYNKQYNPQFLLKDGTLTVRDNRQEDRDGSGWVLMNIDLLWNSRRNTVDIYYDASQKLEKVEINDGTGTVWIDGLQAGELTLDNDIGDITVKNMELGRLTLHQDIGLLIMKNNRIDHTELNKNTGELSVDQLIGQELKAEVEIGGMNFTACELEHAELDCALGDAAMRQWSSNGLKVTSGNGSVDIQGHLGGENRIDSNLGDVDIETDMPDAQYSLDIQTALGTITVDGAESAGNIARKADTGHSITVYAAAGNVDLSFNP